MNDPRDQALYNTCPLHPAPRFRRLEPLEQTGRRLIAGEDGIYIEAKSDYLHACLKLVDLRTPYGPVEEFITLKNGKVPSQILQQFVLRACEASPSEAAAIIEPSGPGYIATAPKVISSDRAHIQYADVEFEHIVIDIHSHGLADAYFSATDDASDLSRFGPYIAVVVGNCRDYHSTRWAARFVCGPYLINLDVKGALLRSVIG